MDHLLLASGKAVEVSVKDHFKMKCMLSSPGGQKARGARTGLNFGCIVFMWQGLGTGVKGGLQGGLL